MTANNVTVTGANGQLGKTLRNLWPTCTLSKQWQLKFFDRSELDITNTEEIEEKLSQTNTNIILNL
ncbi:MAG: sugar nucleotide-binding protein, partial [Proteobacteria bacterium]|nr:sugar nucleotide-binding protein [Pseudomonadota bacterium]